MDKKQVILKILEKECSGYVSSILEKATNEILSALEGEKFCEHKDISSWCQKCGEPVAYEDPRPKEKIEELDFFTLPISYEHDFMNKMNEIIKKINTL